MGILVLGMIGTAVAASATQRRAHQAAEEWVSERAEIVQDATITTVSELVSGVEAVAAFVETSDNITQDSFVAFVGKLDSRLNKIGIAYLPIVPAEERDAFIEMMRTEIPDFAIAELNPFTGEAAPLGADVDVHYPVQFFAPGTFLQEQLPAGDLPLEIGIGVDGASSPTWAESVENAFATGTSTVSSFIPIQYEQTSIGDAFIVSTPVHDDATGKPIGAIGAAMINWLLPTDLSVSITQEIDWTTGRLAEPVPAVDPARGWVGPVELPGTVWQLEVVPTDKALQTLVGTPTWLVWLLGMTLTAGIAAFAQLFRQRLRSRARLSEMQRMSEEKDRFLAAVSHEIRTPLTAVAGLAHELSERPDDFAEDEFHELLGTVAEQSDEVAAIVEDLLVAARSNMDNITVHYGVIDVRTEADLAIDSSGVEVDVIGSNPPAAWADAQRVRQILRNLVTNAGRYGGADVQLRLDADANSVSITVADNGDAIPTEHRERIFDPYTSAQKGREQVGSIGLGLFISRKLASMMDGSLEYRHDGRWSLFTLTIPRAVSTASVFSSPAVPGAARTPANPRSV